MESRDKTKKSFRYLMLRVGLQHIQVRKSKTRGQGHERRRRTEPAEVGRDVVSELFIEVFVILAGRGPVLRTAKTRPLSSR
jgi:hypothetical protein